MKALWSTWIPRLITDVSVDDQGRAGGEKQLEAGAAEGLGHPCRSNSRRGISSSQTTYGIKHDCVIVEYFNSLRESVCEELITIFIKTCITFLLLV